MELFFKNWDEYFLNFIIFSFPIRKEWRQDPYGGKKSVVDFEDGSGTGAQHKMTKTETLLWLFSKEQGQGDGGMRNGPPGKVEFWERLGEKRSKSLKKVDGGLVVEALMSDEELFCWEALEGLWAVEDVTLSCSLGILICSWCVGWVGYFQTQGRPVPVNGRKEYLR